LISLDKRLNSIQVSNGNLWTACSEVRNGNGNIVAMSPETGMVMRTLSFNGTDGSIPEVGVIQAPMAGLTARPSVVERSATARFARHAHPTVQ